MCFFPLDTTLIFWYNIGMNKLIGPKLRSFPAMLISLIIVTLILVFIFGAVWGTMPIWGNMILGAIIGITFSIFYPTKKKKESESACGNWNDTEPNG